MVRLEIEELQERTEESAHRQPKAALEMREEDDALLPKVVRIVILLYDSTTLRSELTSMILRF